MNNSILLSSGASSSWILYVIMGILIVLNITLILYIIFHMSKDQTTKEFVEASRKMKEQHSIQEGNKNNSLKIDGKSTKYVIESDGKMGGWYVRKKGEKQPIAFTKIKDEASEIIKNIEKN